MRFTFAALLAAILAAPLTAQAGTIEWDAGGDGLSTFQEANWVITDETGVPSFAGLLGMDPPAGTVDGATPVPADAIVAGSATAGGAGASNHYDLADGTSLTVRDDATFRMSLGGGRGVRGETDGRGSVVLEGNSLLATQFMLRIDLSLFDNSEIIFNGGGNPINTSSVTLSRDWTGMITFNAETPDDVIIEHLGKMTFADGGPLVVGVNTSIVSDGAVGAVLTVTIPEPSTIAMCGLAALFGGAVALRKRWG